MKRKKRIRNVRTRNARICVSLPEVMLENYRCMAEETGMSVSRVIRTELRSKKQNVILLPRLYTDYVKKIDCVIASALAANTVTPELKQAIETLRTLAYRADVLVQKEEITCYGKT